MKRIIVPLLLTFTLNPAAAQVKIGNVTLTKPSTPAPAQRNAPASGTSSSSSAGLQPVPTGFYEIKGRIGVNKPVSLPAGSTVTVVMEDKTVRGQVVRVQFKTTRLSTPYQVFYSPGRVNGAHKYTIRAVITDASGKDLYTTYAYDVPNARSATINLPVR